MNPAQLSTLSEALEISGILTNAGIGRGVSEIYVPAYGGPFAPPQDLSTGRKFYHLRFNNGAEGINVGLVRETLEKDPATGLQRITIDVNQGERKEVEE
jgi:hypothetical protein